MISATIGRTFLTAYNDKHKTTHSAKAFFENVFVPLFFDYPKYMRSGGNAPLENPKFKNGVRPDRKDRAGRIAKTIEKIETDPEGSSAIGFPSYDVLATTSGQVTNTDLRITVDNVYLSWIGSGLGIGVQGGLAMYFDIPEILMTLYEGWQVYRNNLEEIPALRPNQIDTWNGQWLVHAFDTKNFIESAPMVYFQPFEKAKDGTISIPTQKWVKVLYGISQKFSDRMLTGYVFNLGQTNTTIGFIQFNLPAMEKPLHLYKKLFGENDFLDNAQIIEDLLGTYFSFRASCARGQIGLKALQPAGLMPFIQFRKDELKLPSYKSPMVKPKKGEDNTAFQKREKETLNKHYIQIVTYKTYESWIMANLNNESLYEKAEKYAQCFIAYEKGAGKGRKDRINHVKNVLVAKNRRLFIDALTEIIVNEKLEAINELVYEVNKMPADNFPYFLTLIRFRYAYLNQN